MGMAKQYVIRRTRNDESWGPGSGSGNGIIRLLARGFVSQQQTIPIPHTTYANSQ